MQKGAHPPRPPAGGIRLGSPTLEAKLQRAGTGPRCGAPTLHAGGGTPCAPHGPLRVGDRVEDALQQH
eukprot:15436043-Alexandrium_andersonii.AAC.1